MGKSVFWFRRDLRLYDNHGLYEALTAMHQVIPLFIFDVHILDELPKDDARVTFIHDTLSQMKAKLNHIGSDLLVKYGDPATIWKELITSNEIDQVYTNHDYEPYAKDRDEEVHQLLSEQGIEFHTYKDHVLFEKEEVLTGAGGIYTVFTPYKRKWLVQFEEFYIRNSVINQSFYPSEDEQANLAQIEPTPMPTLASIGFSRSGLEIPSTEVAQKVIKNYAENRNFPGLEDSTSRLGIHFRFGTISIREKALKAIGLSDTYLSELIWRDFYAQILSNFPHVIGQAFRAKYDKIPWRESEEEFKLWCEGKTGYPIVDAGMRELNATGYMHNRVRMITASFLTKHLLMDWRQGEAYFAIKLLDFDLASNNGGWQWASGSGTDAAPYFRIFNPTAQMEKFDKQRTYVKKWVPEYGTDKYPEPMVDHKFARERCLQTYKAALDNA